MKQQSKIKILLYKIRNFFLIIIMTIINFFLNIFCSKQTKKETKQITIKEQLKEIKKEIKTNTEITELPDEPNEKTNDHQNIQKEIEPIEKLYKVYDKDNQIKYLNLNGMLNLLLKEELEKMYKEQKFKLKEASPKQQREVENIKERLFPKLKDRIEKQDITNSEKIREELKENLIEDQEKYPLFEQVKQKTTETKSTPNIIKKSINTKENKITKITKNPEITISSNQELKEKIIEKEKQKQEEIKIPEEQTITDNIKEIGTIAGLTTIGIINELTEQTTTKETPYQQQEKTKNNNSHIITNELPEEITTLPPIEIIENDETLKEEEKEEIIKEIENINNKNKEELVELKKQVEEKIEKIKQEEKKKKEETQKKQEDQLKKEEIEKKEQEKNEKEIIAITEISDNVIEESIKETKKEDFFDKDYDKIERQIDKMLENITNTYLRYENKLTPKQKRKLKQEEERLRTTKEQIKSRKNHDISVEQTYLDEVIQESEISGLKSELDKIHQENEQEVNNNLLERINKLEGMTSEQVRNADKRIMLKRFNKANLILEMTSLLALPFVRNKYFFYFTAGLIVDNHFNFINAFFNRKYSKYEPADLEQIKQGQDALNGALEITYKNLVELEYLEQRAISRYPELKNDPNFINQVTRLKINLNNKYNKLMNKNKVMEKYRMKTKKQRKILKPQTKKDQEKKTNQ